MKKFFVLFTAVALICAFSMPAAADDAEWSFYGSARMGTWYTMNSEDFVPSGWLGGEADTDELSTWNLQGNARIGARVKMGNIGGRFEYGSGPNLRLLYGTYDLGNAQLLFGQGYTPINIFGSNQVFGGDNDLLDSGFPYDGRHPMAQISTMGFKLAFSTPEETGDNVENTLPKVSAKYTFKTDMFKVQPYFGYQTYTTQEVDEETGVRTGVEMDHDSYVYGAAFSVMAGPATINANVTFAENGGDFGLPCQVNNTGDGVETLAAGLVANFAVSDMIKPEVGVGYVENDDEDAEAWNYYVNATINIAKGFFIVPEIGFTDLDENGDQTYVGAKWQINF
jgi:hypothetical protein